MSYSVKAVNDMFDIIEKDTDIVIDIKSTERNARDICRKLNLGSGFNGNTPSFFAKFRGKATRK